MVIPHGGGQLGGLAEGLHRLGPTARLGVGGASRQGQGEADPGLGVDVQERLGAIGGILVAMVIKYADGLAKNLATASSIVATTFVGHWLFGGPMSSSIIIGALIVIVSGYNYQNVA